MNSEQITIILLKKLLDLKKEIKHIKKINKIQKETYKKPLTRSQKAAKRRRKALLKNLHKKI